MLGITAQVVHDLLEVSTDVLRFAPIPGLEEAARTLLSIWDALQLVDVRVSLPLPPPMLTILFVD